MPMLFTYLKRNRLLFLALIGFGLMFSKNVNAQYEPYCYPSNFDCSSSCCQAQIRIFQLSDESPGDLIDYDSPGCTQPEDFSDDFTVPVLPGETYDIFMDFDNDDGHSVNFWIDWDNSGEFQEQHHLIGTDNIYGNGAPFEGEITIPENSAIGEARMRVALSDDVLTWDQVCNNPASLDRGDVQDYTLEIISPGPPTAEFFMPDSSCVGGNLYLESEEPFVDIIEWRVNGVFVSSDPTYVFNPDSAGTYDVTLYLENDEGSDELTRQISIGDPTAEPDANFFASRNVIMQEEVEVDDEDLYRGVVELFDFSTQCPHTWTWEVEPETFDLPDGVGIAPAYEFRDGNDLQSQNTELLFVRPGLYDVTLTTMNDFGDDVVVKEDYLTVSHMMCSDIEPFNSTTDRKGVLTDNNSLDPYTEEECEFVISPCAQDMYIVFDEFELECGEDFLRIYDGVDESGVPLYEACSDKGLDGFTGTTDPEIISDLECESEDMCLPPDTLWSETGTFYVEFEGGSNDEDLQGFVMRWNGEVKTDPPQALYDAPETACTDAEVVFENLTTGEGIEAFAWDYQGDGIINDSNTTGSYSYPVPDTYNPRLFVRDCAGLVDTFESEITVISPSNPPEGTLHASNNTPWANSDTVELSAEFENCVTGQEWSISPEGGFDFVEGYNSNSENPKVVFNESGCFDVSLVAENAEGENVITETCLVDVRLHCRPLLGQSSTDIGVSRTQLGVLDHEREPGESTYSDYTGEEGLQAELVIGQTYTITLSRLSTSNPMSRAVWIDYNRNGSFDDSLELIAYEHNAHTSSYSATFTVPGHANPGETRLRIGTSYGSELLQSCGGVQVGEYVDYRVVIAPDTEAPELTLLGDNPLEMHVFGTYTEPGAEAWDPAYGDLSGQIQIDNSEVDPDVVGTYTVHYSVTDPAGNMANNERTVIVRDTVSPEITLLGDNPLQLEVNTDFEEPGYNISDNYWSEDELDVNITSDLNISEIGEYTIEYCVTDGSGNQSCVVREIDVMDTTPPVIALPADTIQAEVNEPFDMPEVQITDNYWGSDDVDVTYSEFVSFPDELGLIEVEITATDGSGNTATEVLVIEVVDTTPPEIELIGNSYMFVPRYGDFDDPGVHVSDNFDPSPELHTSGTFQGSDMKPGLYNRKYYAVDQSGNESEVVVRQIEVGEPTSISETGEADYKVYPNPTRDKLNIQLAGASREVNLTVTDVSGRTVKNTVIEAGTSPYVLDMSAYDAGTFIISIEDGEDTFKERVVLTD